MFFVVLFNREVFKNFCVSTKETNANPVTVNVENLPQINNKKVRGREATIPGLTTEIFMEILKNHKNSAKSWQKQLEKVT